MSGTFLVNRNPLSTGAVQAQPMPVPRGGPAEKQYSVNSPHEKQIDSVAVSSSKMKSATNSKGLSFVDVVNTIEANDPDKILTFQQNKIFNRIVPDAISLISDLSSMERSEDSPSNFNAGDLDDEIYERLTGISQASPEILSLVEFVPLNKRNDKTEVFLKTPAGKLFDQYLAIRNLRFSNIEKIISFNKKKNREFSTFLDRKRSEFKTVLEDFFATLQFFSGVSNDVENLKYGLDVRSDFNLVNFFDDIKVLYPEISSSEIAIPNFKLAYALSLFGFSEKNIEENYLNTKVWSQLLHEAKKVCSHHSLALFDIKTSQYSEDTSPDRILKIKANYFDFLSNQYQTLPDLDNLVRDANQDLENTLNLVEKHFAMAYSNLESRDFESKVVAILNNLARIFGLSISLNDEKTKEHLFRTYGLSQQEYVGPEIFDAIFGSVPDSIIAPSITLTKNSLLNFSHKKLSEENLILNLESQKLDFGLANVSVGGQYYAEAMLDVVDDKFNIDNATSFFRSAISLERNFTETIKVLDLLDVEKNYEASSRPPKPSINISDPLLLFRDINSLFFDDTSSLDNDPLAPLFSFAAKKPKLKAMLLLHAIANHVVKSAKTPHEGKYNASIASTLKSKIINLLSAELKKQNDVRITKIPNTNFKPVDASDRVSIEAMINSLASESLTVLSNKISSYMTYVFNALASNGAMSSSASRYGGHIDSFLFLVIFDLICSLVEKYSTRKFSDKIEIKGQTYFSLYALSVDSLPSKREILERIKNEEKLKRHSIVAIRSIMKNIANSYGTLISKLNLASSTDFLKKMKIYFFDRERLRLFLRSENQINLLLNQVTENIQEINEGLTEGKSITILDNAEFKSTFINVLEILFSLDEFSSADANLKKIMSVGIPHNLQNRLKKSKRPDKNIQDDIIDVLIYKMDSIHPDIVFLPQRHTFELSRFPAKGSKFLENFMIPSQPKTLDELISKFPTRDRSQVYSSATELVQYLDATSQQSKAFAGKDYDFLTNEQKLKIYKNHIVSYLLEIYCEIMTGISFSEMSLDVKPGSQAGMSALTVNKILITHISSFFDEKSIYSGGNRNVYNSFFSNLESLNHQLSTRNIHASINFAKDNPTVLLNSLSSARPLANILPKLTDEMITQLLYQLGQISDLGRLKADTSEPHATIRDMCDTKLFDRVFNIWFDPQDFYIDVEATGETTLKQLLTSGKIIEVKDSQNQFLQDSETKKPRYKMNKINSKDEIASVDKYFSTVELFDSVKEKKP